MFQANQEQLSQAPCKLGLLPGDNGDDDNDRDDDDGDCYVDGDGDGDGENPTQPIASESMPARIDG